MGGFMGIGGSSANTDRSNQLTSFSQMKNLFNTGITSATSGIGAGLSDLSSAGGYFKSLLGGNRAALNAAVAPETAAVQAGDDASKRQAAASGTARGGGVAGTMQTSKDATMAKVQQLLFGVRPAAAEGLTKVGTAEAGIGSNILQTSSNTAGELAAASTNARKIDLAQNNAIGQSVGQMAAALLMMA